MNWFAIAVITLQVLACCKYAWDRQFPDAVVYIAAAAINIAIMMKGRV